MHQLTKQKLPKEKHKIFFYTPAIVWGILILYFSLMPGEKVPDLLKAIQSFLIHVSIYFLQAVFIFLGASKFKLIPVSKSAFSLAFVFILVVGGFIEVIQEFYIEKRHGELEDVIANLLGGILAIFSWRILTKK